MDKSARRFLDADGRVLVLRNQEKDSLLYNTSIYYETKNLNAAKAEIVDAPGIKNTKALHFIIKEPNVIKDSIKSLVFKFTLEAGLVLSLLSQN